MSLFLTSAVRAQDITGLGERSEVRAVSGDGSVVVGYLPRANPWYTDAFRWTEAGGMQGLGFLARRRGPGPGYASSAALDVNADGSVVVGHSTSDNGTEAFRWTDSGGMQGLGYLPGGLFASAAQAVNADGYVVVGLSLSSNGMEAFRWTGSGGMQGLGDLPGHWFHSAALAVNADGTVVVGFGTTIKYREAIYWTTHHGMRSLASVLKDQGVSVSGTQLTIANDVSDDGLVVVGNGKFGDRNEAYIARLIEEDPYDHNATEAGLISISSLNSGIAQMAAVVERGNSANFADLRSFTSIATHFSFPSLGRSPTPEAPYPPPAALGMGAAADSSRTEQPARSGGQPYAFVLGSLTKTNNDDFDGHGRNGLGGIGTEVLPGLTVAVGALVSKGDGDLPA